MDKGDDVITTFLSGCLLLIVGGIIMIGVLAVIFS
jgi:hypothetical protein